MCSPVADPGEGPEPPLFSDQNEAQRAEKFFFETVPPPPTHPLSHGLDDQPESPESLKFTASFNACKESGRQSPYFGGCSVVSLTDQYQTQTHAFFRDLKFNASANGIDLFCFVNYTC